MHSIYPNPAYRRDIRPGIRRADNGGHGVACLGVPHGIDLRTGEHKIHRNASIPVLRNINADVPGSRNVG